MTAQPKHLSLAFEHQKDMKCEILLGDTWGGGVGGGGGRKAGLLAIYANHPGGNLMHKHKA